MPSKIETPPLPLLTKLPLRWRFPTLNFWLPLPLLCCFQRTLSISLRAALLPYLAFYPRIPIIELFLVLITELASFLFDDSFCAVEFCFALYLGGFLVLFAFEPGSFGTAFDFVFVDLQVRSQWTGPT